MPRFITSLAFVLTACLFPTSMQAETTSITTDADTLFVYLKNGRLDVYPPEVVKNQAIDEQGGVVTTLDGKSHVYQSAQVDSISNHGPKNMPTFTSFKFNNKFNGQVFTDVQCEIGPDGLITGSVNAIGKWLTPSFQLSDEDASVYIGRQLQHSKVSRRSFAEPVDYVITRDGWQVMTLSSDEEQPDDDPDEEPDEEPDLPYTKTLIPLTGDLLSTNAPTKLQNEDLPMVLDGDPYTFFHSTWSSSGYDVLPLDSCPWIEVKLPEAQHYLVVRYLTRSANDRWPLAVRIDVSADGSTWKAAKEFTAEEDGLPLSTLTWWESSPIDLGGDYSYVRFVCTRAAYKNYLCLAELELYSVTFPPDPNPEPDPEPTLPDGMTLSWQPFGTRYTVSIDWPTDRATSVPTVYITTEIGRKPYDKNTYLTGTIAIDGAGVYPDLGTTSMQIKGRGNSSWAGENGKSPYRIKLDTKLKPFGLTKGKNWVLLANRQSGSMMSNAIGMKVAQLAGAAGANHIIPVELYINGEYRGSYNFTEHVSISNNSINLDDESQAAMLELDSYFDETYKFRGSQYNMPVNIKKPEFDDENPGTILTMEDIKADWNELLNAVNDGLDITNYAEADTLAAFWLTNELILNQELMHPKSTFVYKERVGDPDDKWKFGPVWDLDWAFGYEGSSTYFRTGATDDLITRRWMECNYFWQDLRACGENFDRTYYKAWTRQMRNGLIEELYDFCQEYYDYANPSFVHNASLWSDGRNYQTQVGQAQQWLKQRAEYIYRKLTPYDLSDDLPEDEDWKPYNEEVVIEPIDATPYNNVRKAVESLLADTEAYTCEESILTPVYNTIQQENYNVERATADVQVQESVASLRAAFVEWLSNGYLEIHKTLDLTDILISNPSPVADAAGWTCSEAPHAFSAENRVAEFLSQSGATLSQTVALPAGTYAWQAIALTRIGYKSCIYADDQTRNLATASRSDVSNLSTAAAWLDQGNGSNSLTFELKKTQDVELGLRADQGTGTNNDHWTVWRNFRLLMTAKPVRPTVNTEQYQNALANIKSGKRYRILTYFNGTSFGNIPYYLGRDGYLTENKSDDNIFEFTQVEGAVGGGNSDLFVSPGWQTDACFTNPTLSDKSSGDIVPRGYISTNTDFGRNNWEGQVWYLDGERYAVRATNAPAGTWGAETFWFVEDVNNDNIPEAGYSWDPYFLWQLEEFIYDGISSEQEEGDWAAEPVFDLSGRRMAARYDQFLQSARPGIYIVGGHKITIR